MGRLSLKVIPSFSGLLVPFLTIPFSIFPTYACSEFIPNSGCNVTLVPVITSDVVVVKCVI